MPKSNKKLNKKSFDNNRNNSNQVIKHIKEVSPDFNINFGVIKAYPTEKRFFKRIVLPIQYYIEIHNSSSRKKSVSFKLEGHSMSEAYEGEWIEHTKIESISKITLSPSETFRTKGYYYFDITKGEKLGFINTLTIRPLIKIGFRKYLPINIIRIESDVLKNSIKGDYKYFR